MQKKELYIQNYIYSKLNKKYSLNDNIYDIYLIEKIIYNETCHLVAIFKDFLIYDDNFEFLKKYYKMNQTLKKLKTYFNYYEQYSILYPNYLILHESKYIYENIHKKQKIIYENLRNDKNNINKILKDNEDISHDLFNSKIYNSIFNFSENGCNSIFGLSKKEKKGSEDDNASIFLINNIIKTIENKEKEKRIQKRKDRKKIEYNFKLKTNHLIKSIINNINISINLNKSNNSKNKNNTFIFNKVNNLNSNKTIVKEKEPNQSLFFNLRTKMLNNVKKNTIYPLNLSSTSKKSAFSLTKYNEFKRITNKKPNEIKLNLKKYIKTVNSSINIKNINVIKNEKTKKLNRNKVIKINKNYSIYNTCNKRNNIENNNKLTYNIGNTDLIKSLREKKINKESKKFQKVKTQNFNNKNKNILYLKNLKPKKEGSKEKKGSTKFLFISNLLNKRYNTYSNKKQRYKPIYDENYHNNIANQKVINYKKKIFNNSNSVKALKNRLNNYKTFNSEEKNKEKSLINICSKNISSNSTIKSFKKITKKIMLNNIILNLSGNHNNNSLYMNKSKRNLKTINLLIGKFQESSSKPKNLKINLKGSHIQTIEVNISKNKHLKIPKT